MHFFEHTATGLCWWDIPQLVILLVATGWFFIKRHKMKEEEKNLRNQMSK